MRVLMTTDTVGGVWTFTRQLAAELLESGHSVALVSFGRQPSASQREWCDATAAHHDRFEYTPGDCALEWMQDNEDAYERGAPLLLSVAREFAPDVLLTSQYCFAALPVVIPKVVVAHSDVLSWARACRTVPLPRTAWLDRYVRLVSAGLHAADAVVAPTSWMLSALSEFFTLPEHAQVIPNGCNVLPGDTAIRRRQQAITAGRFWDEAKNLVLLKDLRWPVPIIVAGEIDGPPAPDASSCTFVGELPEAALHNLFRQSTIYLCTSIYEPFGLAPLEAALCGCAVVANDIPSLREVWGDDATFFNDAASLAEVLSALRDPDQLQRAQASSIYRAQQFTARRMADAYVGLFDRLLLRESGTVRSGAHAA